MKEYKKLSILVQIVNFYLPKSKLMAAKKKSHIGVKKFQPKG